MYDKNWLRSHNLLPDYILDGLTHDELQAEINHQKRVNRELELHSPATDKQKRYMLVLGVDEDVVYTIDKSAAIKLIGYLCLKATPAQKQLLQELGVKDIPRTNEDCKKMIAEFLDTN